jgi:hypothetical protein
MRVARGSLGCMMVESPIDEPWEFRRLQSDVGKIKIALIRCRQYKVMISAVKGTTCPLYRTYPLSTSIIMCI